MKARPLRGRGAACWIAAQYLTRQRDYSRPKERKTKRFAWGVLQVWAFWPWALRGAPRTGRSDCLRMIHGSVSADQPYYGAELSAGSIERMLRGDLLYLRDEARRDAGHCHAHHRIRTT